MTVSTSSPIVRKQPFATSSQEARAALLPKKKTNITEGSVLKVLTHSKMVEMFREE